MGCRPQLEELIPPAAWPQSLSGLLSESRCGSSTSCLMEPPGCGQQLCTFLSQSLHHSCSVRAGRVKTPQCLPGSLEAQRGFGPTHCRCMPHAPRYIDHLSAGARCGCRSHKGLADCDTSPKREQSLQCTVGTTRTFLGME